MHALFLVGALFGALAADPAPLPEPWQARLTLGARAAKLDSPQPLGLSFFTDASLELRMFGHVALQVGSWPVVVPTPVAVAPGSCGSPAPATLRAGVSEFGDFWELGALAGVTLNTSALVQCATRSYLLLMPFFRVGRDQDWGVDGGLGFFYTTLKEAWLGAHAPVGPLRAFLDARLSMFGWAEADLGVEVPGAVLHWPAALRLRLEAGLAAVGWTLLPQWRLGPQGGAGMSWTW